MVAISVVGSWAIRAVAFAMKLDAPPSSFGGFNVGLSLPIPLVQLAPHWYAIFAFWFVCASLALFGWQAVRALNAAGCSSLWPVYAGYGAIALVLTFFSVTLSIDGYFYTTFARLYGVFGINPYELASPIPTNDHVLAQEFQLLNNPPFPDPYGAGFTLLAGLVGRLESGASLWTMLWTFRIIAVFASLLTLAALAHVLRGAEPRERVRRVALVAFHPLMLYESGVGGHNDFLMVAAALWSYALVDEMPLIAGLLLGAAIAIKYFAAVLLPFVVLRAARKQLVAAALIVVLAALVPVLCFHPFTFGPPGEATLAKVGSSLSMSLNWLLALPLLAAHAPDAKVRLVQLVIGIAFLIVALISIVRYARALCNVEIFRTITALLWSLPAMHPWYAAWLIPASAVSRRWALYAWWFAALSLLLYAHEAVLPTSANHATFIVVTIFFLVAPLFARFASEPVANSRGAGSHPNRAAGPN